VNKLRAGRPRNRGWVGGRGNRHKKTGSGTHPQWRTEGGFQPPPPTEIPNTLKNRAKLNPTVKTAEFRTPTPQDVRKKGSKVPKIPPVRNCFTLAMTNKLVVIINSLKVHQKLRKFYYMK